MLKSRCLGSPKCPTLTPARAPSNAGACVTSPHLGGVSHANLTHKSHRANARVTRWRITGGRDGRAGHDCGKKEFLTLSGNLNRKKGLRLSGLYDPYSRNLTNNTPICPHLHTFHVQKRIARLPAKKWNGRCIQADYL